MHRGVAELDDAVSVIILMESTAATCTLDAHDESSLFQDPTITVFPEADKADIEFLYDKAKVLEKYQMQNLLSQDESKILIEEKRKSQDSTKHAFDACWNTVINHNDPSIVVNTKKTVPGSSEVGNYENTQDHYGRCTQFSPNVRGACEHSGKSPNIPPTNLSYSWPTVQNDSNLSFYAPSNVQGRSIERGDTWNEPDKNRISSSKAKEGRKRRSAD